MDRDATLSAKLALILPHLDERQRRLLLAAEAKVLGRGGVSRVAAVAGVSRPTIRKGLAELARPALAAGRVRRVGGGRKRLTVKDPGLVAALDALVDPTTRGDPMSPLRWTCKSTRQLAQTLTQQGHPTSHRAVAELLHTQGYSLQANAKMIEGAQHPDRDAQFRYLNDQVQTFLAAGLPVISVDAKKKELVGRFKAVGREWQPQGQPEAVNVHDFEDPALGKAIPYGIYDVGRNAGWVNVGQDHDTATFAVESIRRWWQAAGRPAYPDADRILISADGGGSNGYRLRLWKWELSRWAAEAGLTITVCHLPPGTSKWNKIEHRLFSYITMNIRGRPLESQEVVVQLIAATSTRTGLGVEARTDDGTYPTGLKVTDEDMASLKIEPHPFHGEWNYTLHP
ncbi:Rhodopirellula transposase family protein [mine drainage metagenome]|uniref:Rhodopirellula transposase family protein n=1 Tax=mine drainage metagenome TaxID=410659 RepID=T1CVV9_9ZZZZ